MVKKILINAFKSVFYYFADVYVYLKTIGGRKGKITSDR